MSETGNLYRGDFATEFMETAWDGCAHRDCLPNCRTIDGHCERLKLEYDEWLRRSPPPEEVGGQR